MSGFDAGNWSDEDRVKYIDSFEPSVHQKERTCYSCDRSMEVEAWFKEDDGEYRHVSDALCVAGGDDPQELWESICFYLNQFITCDLCREKSDVHACDGCEAERYEVLKHVWHYGHAILNEWKAKDASGEPRPT